MSGLLERAYGVTFKRVNGVSGKLVVPEGAEAWGKLGELMRICNEHFGDTSRYIGGPELPKKKPARR